MKIKLLSGILLSITFIGSFTMPPSNQLTTTQFSNNENPFYSESDLYMKFPPFDKIKNCSTIGISSGASAPDVLVKNFINEIKQELDVIINEIEIIKENVSFKVPKKLSINT